MSNLIKATFDRFDELMRESEVSKRLPLDDDSKYAIVSDLHLGDGKSADNLVHNELAVQDALEYYRDNDYSVIMAGDIEELWQFDLDEIRGHYGGGIYAVLRSFLPGRVHRVYGNHDGVWAGLSDPSAEGAGVHRWATEAIRLGDQVLITHGHQGEVLCDKSTWVSRFAARAFRYVEPVARWLGYGDTADTKTVVPNDRERTYYRWAKERMVILICGHTHRAVFASRPYSEQLKEEREKLRRGRKTAEATRRIIYLTDELERETARGRNIELLEEKGDPLPCYFNCGCGGYKTGFTAIEIEGKIIRLMKWHNDETLPQAGRREQYVGKDLHKFIEKVASSTVP